MSLNGVRVLARRSLATQAKPLAASENIQLTTLANKTVVACVDSPVRGLTKVGVAIRAGSRYEGPDNAGVSHVLRSSCGLSTACSSQFAITKNLQKLGSTLSATSDREIILYSLEATIDHLEESLAIFKNAITGQVFKPWELSDNITRIKYELATIPPQALAFDLIHKAAYRSGLGNSIFVKEHNIKNIGSETLQHFVAERFLASKVAVVGVGAPLDELTSWAEKLNLESADGSSAAPSQFKGDDLRLEMNSKFVHAVIAGEASGLNKKEVFTYAVLAKALGSGSSIKRGAGVDPLSKVQGSSPSVIRAVNMAHSDSGLFGIAVSTESNSARDVIMAVVKALKSGVSDADVSRAKAQLKADILFGAESCEGLLFDLANQSVLVGSARTAGSLVADIDAVTTQQVKDALSKFASGKKSMATVGNVARVPYVDEL